MDVWPKILPGDEVLATPILDRLLRHSHVPNITGRSYRLRDLKTALEATAWGMRNIRCRQTLGHERYITDSKRKTARPGAQHWVSLDTSSASTIREYVVGYKHRISNRRNT